MEQILTVFGIDWRLLLINSINFGLLLLALWYFMYGPLMRVLEDRRRKVQEGVEHAEAAGHRLAEIEASKAATLAAAGKDADTIVSQARAAALAKEREIVAQADAAAENLLKDAQAQAVQMKSEAIEESKKEVAKLIVLGMEKTLQSR